MKAFILTQDGEFLTLQEKELSAFLNSSPPPLLVHSAACCEALHIALPPSPRPWLDLLDLFLFVHPAKTLPSPTPEGLAQALNLPFRDTPDMLYDIARCLLSEIDLLQGTAEGTFLNQLFVFLSQSGWAWKEVLATYFPPLSSQDKNKIWQALSVWSDLPEWEDPIIPPPSFKPLLAGEATENLLSLLKETDTRRNAQENFAEKIKDIFSLPEEAEQPHIVMAEAETGTGKTLAYLAAAECWARKNDAQVWISTYTKNLQRQVEQELLRFYPDASERRKHAVVLKGRENYLCLLKFQEKTLSLFSQMQTAPQTLFPASLPVGLLLNWIRKTADGDIKGGDLAGWFGQLYGFGYIFDYMDKEGECLHGGCPLFKKCFFEQIIRRAAEARLIISNHAFTLIHLAKAGEKESFSFPFVRHFIFDESHHLAHAADNVFSEELSLKGMMDFRNRLLGSPKQSQYRRFKGLPHYLKTGLSEFDDLDSQLSEVETKGRKIFPSWGVQQQFFQQNAEDSEKSETKDPFVSLIFFQSIAAQLDIYAPPSEDSAFGGMSFEREADFLPALAEVTEAGASFLEELRLFLKSLLKLYKILKNLPLQQEEDSEFRRGVEIVSNRLEYYLLPALKAWISMLEPLPSEKAERSNHIRIIRGASEKTSKSPEKIWKNVRLCQNWIDPTKPLSSSLQKHALGIAYVSGTFRPYRPSSNDDTDDKAKYEQSWYPAKRRTGMLHLNGSCTYDFQKSPFDYKKQAKIYILTDISYTFRDLSHAYLHLFLASNGGALGLFTAIFRLQHVYQTIKSPLARAGIDLYAQHINNAENTQLVELFRQNQKSCLLGTDAMRDGIDIPGKSLQLVVMEKVPWPRGDILHRERKKYVKTEENIKLEEEEAALRLRQAFGRLIRKSEDRGVFVILERRTPSRILKALPEEIEIEKTTLGNAITGIKKFLNEQK